MTLAEEAFVLWAFGIVGGLFLILVFGVWLVELVWREIVGPGRDRWT